MSYEVRHEGDEATLSISGTLDAATAPGVRTVVDRLVSERCLSVSVDLSGLNFIDSAGVGVIVSLSKGIRANGGVVRIVGIRDQPESLFRQLRIDRVIPV